MARIEGIFAREILDSRGIPTVECTVWLDTGGMVVSSAPAGTSIGKLEALEVRDNDPTRMLGKGVLTVVNNINTIIAPALKGQDPTQQQAIDRQLLQLDGTENKSKLGANALIAVSQAVLKAGALASNMPLYFYLLELYKLTERMDIPTCIYTMVNGGEHGAQNLDLQDFQVVPATHMSYKDSLNLAVTIFNKLEEVLIVKGAIHSVGLVGGFAPNLYSNTDVFEILIETIKTSQYTFAQDIFFGIDAAASELYSNSRYVLKDKAQGYTSAELIEYYHKLRSLYHVFYIEDPFREEDTKAWKELTKLLGETSRIIADDLVSTNKKKVEEAIQQQLCNTIVVKPNQVGTITETIEVIQAARSAGWKLVVSHRSGDVLEVGDVTIELKTTLLPTSPWAWAQTLSSLDRRIEESVSQSIIVYYKLKMR